MAKYTVELRTLIESGFDLGLDTYPIFDENYRKELNRKIINHYYFREIGFETPALFRFYLNTAMAENMVYFNQLYNSALIEFNPLENFSETESESKAGNKNDDFTGTSTDTKSESGSSTKTDESTATESAESLNVYSDTPQGLISIGDIKTSTYASNATLAEGTTTGTETAENTASYETAGESSNVSESLNKQSYTEIITKTRAGNRGENPAEMIKKFRETFLNVDKMVIDSLSKLFMNIF